jgi:hypothetical protein
VGQESCQGFGCSGGIARSTIIPEFSIRVPKSTCAIKAVLKCTQKGSSVEELKFKLLFEGTKKMLKYLSKVTICKVKGFLK